MTSERGFERERDWTQGPAKWAAVVALGAACVLTSAWVMAGRVRIEREAAGSEIGRAAAVTAPVATSIAPNVVTPPTPDVVATAEPLGPAAEPVTDAATAPGPLAPTASDTTSASDDTPNVARRININTASAAELELLPGVGPKLAERIIDHRKNHGTFKKVDDLDGVSGIGTRILERLRPLVTVE